MDDWRAIYYLNGTNGRGEASAIAGVPTRAVFTIAIISTILVAIITSRTTVIKGAVAVTIGAVPPAMIAVFVIVTGGE